MFYIDWTLRLASLAVAILVFFQIFSKEKGNRAHRVRGYWAMVLGVIIFICIFIRGMQNEHFSFAYVLHLCAGAPFFIFLFLTGRYGYLTEKVNEKYLMRHKMSAYATFVTLLITLVLGVISVSSH